MNNLSMIVRWGISGLPRSSGLHQDYHYYIYIEYIYIYIMRITYIDTYWKSPILAFHWYCERYIGTEGKTPVTKLKGLQVVRGIRHHMMTTTFYVLTLSRGFKSILFDSKSYQLNLKLPATSATLHQEALGSGLEDIFDDPFTRIGTAFVFHLPEKAGKKAEHQSSWLNP